MLIATYKKYKKILTLQKSNTTIYFCIYISINSNRYSIDKRSLSTEPIDLLSMHSEGSANVATFRDIAQPFCYT